jgi:hypothetical protein
MTSHSEFTTSHAIVMVFISPSPSDTTVGDSPPTLEHVENMILYIDVVSGVSSPGVSWATWHPL